MEAIKDRIAYLQKQLAWYKSTGDKNAIMVYSAIINELHYWLYIIECEELKRTDKRALLN